MDHIDPTKTRAAAVDAALDGDDAAILWLSILVPDLAEELGITRDLRIAEELDAYQETVFEQAIGSSL